MKYFIFLILSISCLSLNVIGKTVDAPEYNRILKKSYIDKDKQRKSPNKSGYSGVPGSKFWRSVRSNKSFQTQAKGNDAGVLINVGGEGWRLSKNKISITSGIIIALTFLIPLLLYFAFGKFTLKEGFSGNVVERFKFIERVIHWGTAGLFILLAITGLTLALGKFIFIPIMGKTAFAAIAAFFKDIHNIFGPIFSVFLLLLIIKFAKDNLYQKGDINWLLKGGGLFGEHADSWRFNFGEKAWFWIVFFAGLLVSISGFVLLFSDIVAGQRDISALSQVIHSITSTLMIAGMFGHIYMGVAMEGSMSAITNGTVDKNWAKEHHSLWYNKQNKEN